MVEENAKQPAKVLVVDDNEQNLELLVAYLEDIDCRIVTAMSGEGALDIIKQGGIDLVLLDVMMPKMEHSFGKFRDGVLKAVIGNASVTITTYQTI
ncbi:hypothetical protein LCGC14_3034330 [marine sediment metagenome]|uniref:Response regulatory domain-containing protein n=1 Tax=marine sediment metagenome TaxID=412755 RepID=A0A0F8ZHK1_9ZZZZ